MSIREEDEESSREQGRGRTIVLNGLLESRSKGGEGLSPEKHLEKTVWGKRREQSKDLTTGRPGISEKQQG